MHVFLIASLMLVMNESSIDIYIFFIFSDDGTRAFGCRGYLPNRAADVLHLFFLLSMLLFSFFFLCVLYLVWVDLPWLYLCCGAFYIFVHTASELFLCSCVRAAIGESQPVSQISDNHSGFFARCILALYVGVCC